MSSRRWQHLLVSLFPVLAVAVLFFPLSTYAQTFRGAINGTVTDPSGAVVPGAAVEAVQAGTGVSLKTVSSSGGEFVFRDLPVGSYEITVTASGFKVEKIASVPVSAGSTYTLPVKVGIQSTGQTVEVSANALALDTTTTVQTTDIPSVTVQNTPMNGRDFTQLVSVTPGYAGYSGGGYGSVNGTRPDMINWQIEGADNNDVWWNIPAANQGGISGIAGVTLPLDAIDQVSVVTEAGPDIGRSPGATVNLAIKSGSNAFHGSAYYYNRNEALAAQSQLLPDKPELRNQQFGGSVGGPIIKDKLFFFTTYEEQKFVIGVGLTATEPSIAYQKATEDLLSAYGITPNQTALNLLNGNGTYPGLWPSSSLTGLATPGNYSNPNNEFGFSHNGLIKLDYSLNDRNKISAKWYVGQGPQVAPTVSTLSPYFEVGPMHVQNYSLTWNTVLSSRITNQAFAGVNYYNQSFSDADKNFNPIGLGLNTGVSSSSLEGAPRIQISQPSASSGLGSSSDGFDFVGATVDSGRNDITGHLNDSLSLTIGKHELHFGGEYRQAQIDDFYQADQRGTFVFDGTQGPWTAATGGTPSAACAALATKSPSAASISSTYGSDPHFFELADFLAGCFDPSNTSIVQGNPKRQVFIDSWGAFAQDTFQFKPTLTLNYGLRYEYNGPLHSQYKDLSTFLPGAPNGLAVVGEQIPFLYPRYYGGFGPRVGVSWQPASDPNLAIRAGFGLGYDNPNIVNFVNSRFSSNGGAFGIQDNPAGSILTVDTSPTASVIPSGAATGDPIFPNALAGVCISNPNAAGCSIINVFSVSQKLRSGYVENYNLNAQRTFGRNVLAQLGYVGSSGRRLRDLVDINQAAQSTTGVQQSTRPFYSAYPNYGVINQVQSNATSNYNSLQALVRVSNFHRLTTQLAYTWGHSMDEISQIYLYNPQNSLCLKCDYGNSDFDVANTFVSYVSYELPNASHGPKLLTNGWQVNSLVTFHGGLPFTIFSSNSGGSGTGENAERANLNLQINDAYGGVSHSVVGTSASGYSVNWLNPNAYTPSINGQFGNSHRNDLHGPGYSDVDFSVFKNTKITERINTQFRVEMFNLFNYLNLAQPGDGFCTDSSTCSINETVGASYGAPGIGAGEPFNTQLALKVIF